MSKLKGRKLIQAVLANTLLRKLNAEERELVQRLADNYSQYLYFGTRTSSQYRKQGMCIRCGVVKVKKGHCESCLKLIRAEWKERSAIRMKAGLCVRCKQEKDNKDLTLCADCRKVQHEYR